MGIYRFILAICVIVSHLQIDVYGYNIGVVAVISFILLSGYVMTALIQKYYLMPFNVSSFYLDRLFRLFPQYLFYFILTSVCIYLFDIQNAFLTALTLDKWVLNLLMFPLGFYMFWSNGDALVIHPAWSLGLEFTFYLIIPFILRYLSFYKKIVLIICSIIIFLAAYFGKIHTDWYGYRLLPGVLYIFMMGSFFYKPQRKHLYCIAAVFLLAVLLYINLYYHSSLYQLVYSKEVLLGFIIGILALAMLKKWTFKHIDKFLGDLSYGVFLNHVIVIWILDKFLLDTYYSVILIISCLLSFLSYYLIEIPALKWRAKIRLNSLG